MINNKKLTLSIVIPVFNEEDYLDDCLASIAAQSDKPDEVIVVDNNSTDRSVQVAKKFAFVKIVHESRQHQSFAQKTGFNTARSDIIGRIDADTILPDDWVEKVKKVFASQPKVQAITGAPDPYDVSMKNMAVGVFMLYHNLASLIAGTQMIWGASSAIRRSAWLKIRDHVLQRGDIWEDYDLSLLLAKHGKICHQPGLKVKVSFRAVHKSFFTQVSYQFRCIRTFYLRKGVLRAGALSLVWYTMILLYPLALLDEKVLKPLSSLSSRQREVLESAALVD